MKLHSINSLAIYLIFINTESVLKAAAFLKMWSNGLPLKRIESNSDTTFCLTTDPKEIYFCFCYSL
jgi:hypothetical protein